jgi:YD repeat-containing protein
LTVTTADRVITYTYDDQGRPLSTSVRATEE